MSIKYFQWTYDSDVDTSLPIINMNIEIYVQWEGLLHFAHVLNAKWLCCHEKQSKAHISLACDSLFLHMSKSYRMKSGQDIYDCALEMLESVLPPCPPSISPSASLAIPLPSFPPSLTVFPHR